MSRIPVSLALALDLLVLQADLMRPRRLSVPALHARPRAQPDRVPLDDARWAARRRLDASHSGAIGHGARTLRTGDGAWT